MRDGNSISEKEAREVQAFKPGRRAKLLIVAGSIVFALLVCEVALRVAGYTYPVFYTTDQTRGYALRPGAEGWYRKEGKSYVRINSEGLRDQEHAKRKPPGTLRIAIIGDSYAEALQVSQSAAFWSIMGERLQGCEAFDGHAVEVINFGVSGYGTAQELITLRERVWTFAPDIVLLAVTTNNDITDNSRALKRTDEVPYFVLRGDTLALDDSFRSAKSFRLRDSILSRAGAWIRNQLRVVQAIHEGHGALMASIKRWRARKASEVPAVDNIGSSTSSSTATDASAPKQQATPLTTNSDELGADNLVYREPDDAVWREAWTVTEKLITAMRDEVNGHGAKFVVVTLSNAVQVNPDPSLTCDFLQRVGASDIFYPDRRIKSLGEREGFIVFNLAPELQQYAVERKVFLHGFAPDIGNGHWNEQGHRVAGELLARKICEDERERQK